jgi:hypothetical protein
MHVASHNRIGSSVARGLLVIVPRVIVRSGSMRHDADVAITLLNKLSPGDATNEHCMEILREGQLRFDVLRCTLAVSALECDDGIEMEWVKFGDGSRALRLLHSDDLSDVTPWIACPPLRRFSDPSHT